MSENFIFYDTETSGRDPFFDQIFQFAAVLTDAELNPIDEVEYRARRMAHIVPSAGALLVNGLNPFNLNQAQFSAYEFAKEIKSKILQWSPAVVSGYNIFSFDERFMRSMFYQNLLPPYLTQTNGNTRIDILPLVQALEVLEPGAITYPINEKGKTSKKLEHIAAANGFEGHRAHDALGDVEATIFVANLVKTRAPRLWEAARNARSRRHFKTNVTHGRWSMFHDINYGWPTTFPGLVIGDVNNGRDVLCLDLRHKAVASLDLGNNDLFAGRNRLFRVLRAAEMPLAFSWEDFSSFSCSASFDYQEIIESCTAWKPVLQNLSIIEAFESMRSEFPEAEHPEQKIYEGFDAFDAEAHTMDRFHNCADEQKLDIAKEFYDPRFRTFAQRIIFDSFGHLMEPKLFGDFSDRVTSRMCDEGDVPWNTIPKALLEIGNLRKSKPDRLTELATIEDFLHSLRGSLNPL
jgi:exodeoxyribonuclease-1